MRLHAFIIAAFVAIGACDSNATPIVAGLGGSDTSATNGTAAIVISPSQVQLPVGATYQFGTNAPLDMQDQVQWGSLETTIVTTSPSGLVTAVAPGTATITARYASDTSNVSTATVVVTGSTTP